MEKTSLVEDVRNYLRDAILTLKYKPGEQLNESAILSELEVSRSPLREAFRLLEGEGLVTWRSRKGVFVNDISPDDIKELFPIRASLESLAAELAAPRLNEKELQELETIVEKMDAAANQGNTRAYLKLNFNFHRQIVKAADNKRLDDMIKTLGRQSTWYIFAAIYFKKVQQVAFESHRDIFMALKERDGKKAAELIGEHIRHGALKILEHIENKGGSAD